MPPCHALTPTTGNDAACERPATGVAGPFSGESNIISLFFFASLSFFLLSFPSMRMRGGTRSHTPRRAESG